MHVGVEVGSVEVWLQARENCKRSSHEKLSKIDLYFQTLKMDHIFIKIIIIVYGPLSKVKLESMLAQTIWQCIYDLRTKIN